MVGSVYNSLTDKGKKGVVYNPLMEKKEKGVLRLPMVNLVLSEYYFSLKLKTLSLADPFAYRFEAGLRSTARGFCVDYLSSVLRTLPGVLKINP